MGALYKWLADTPPARALKKMPLLAKLILAIKGKTSERIIPDLYRSSEVDRVLTLKHRFAYEFAKQYLKPSATALDYGCGDGYGCAILAQACGECRVIGTDIDRKAVRAASKKYRHGNLSFLPFGEIQNTSQKFDLITSFQVIEHVQDVKAYLEFLRGLLTDSGVLVISTPNRNYRLSEGQPPWNPYHLTEYSYAGFEDRVGEVFENSHFYSLCAEPGLLEVEINRVAPFRDDKTPCEIKIPDRDGAVYEWSGFWLVAGGLDCGLDLFCVSRKGTEGRINH